MTAVTSVGTAESSVAHHLFGTLFEFNNEAKDEILSSFRAIASSDASCELAEKNYFLIHCPKEDDISVSLFSEVLASFIKTESERKLDLFEDSRLTRIAGTYADPTMNRSRKIASQTIACVRVSDEASLIPGVSESDDSPPPLAPSNIGSMSKFYEGLLIEHELITRTWNPCHNSFVSLKTKDYVLGKIETLCNCRLLPASSVSQDIIIKGDSEKDIEKAISKLSVVDKGALEMLSYPLGFSYPISEGELGPMLQMVTLDDLDDVRVQSTLLLPDSPLFDIVGTALVVSMIQKGQRVPLKQSGIRPSTKEALLWRDYPNQPFGNEIGAPHKYDSPPKVSVPVAVYASEGTSISSVARWVQQDRQSYFDPFQPDPEPQEAAHEPSREPDNKSPLEQTPITMKPSTKRARTAKGASKAAATPSSETMTSPNVKPIPVIQAMAMPKTTATTAYSTEPHPRTPSSFRSSLGHVSAPLIERPYNASFESGISAESLLSGEWQTKPVSRAKGGHLIEVEGKREGLAQKKDLRRTMDQKKSRKVLNGSNIELIRRFEIAARQILDATLLHGPVQMKVCLGRLLVSPQTRPAAFKSPFAVAEWPSVFPPTTGVNGMTEFTPRITTSAPDIDAILSIKLSQGQSLFAKTPVERTVSYTISCLSKSQGQIIMEISGNESFELKGSKRLVGALDWHFPLRSWDSRLQFTIQEPLMGNFQLQAEGIVRNMRVDIDANNEILKFSTRTIDQELVIQSVIRRRTTIHTANNVYTNLLLHLEELQNLPVQRMFENDYQSPLPAKMDPASKMWWEVSLTSVKAAAILKESEEVEFGDVGKWSPKKIIDEGAIKDLYTLANEVVTRIDSIGRPPLRSDGTWDRKQSLKTRTDLNPTTTGGSQSITSFW